MHSRPANIILFHASHDDSWCSRVYRAKDLLGERGDQSGLATKSECDLEGAFSYRAELSLHCVNYAREG